jgi:prevent-host-death family protein
MCESESMTQRLNATQARQEWSQLLNRVFRRETRVVVERSGIPVAAIVSAHDLERLKRMEDEETRALDRMRAAFSDVTEEQIVKDVDAVVEEVRQDERSRRAAANE